MKYELLEMSSGRSLVKGLIDRLFTSTAMIRHENQSGKHVEKSLEGTSFADGICWLIEQLQDEGVINKPQDIDIVIHKLAHGGEQYSRPTLIDDAVIKNLEELYSLAPVHLPPAVEGIKVCKERMKFVKQYAFFETSFHNTIPEYAYLYGLPYTWYSDLGVRKYGFHSASHQYVSEKCAQLLDCNSKQLKIVSCHLGSGTSVAAIDGGKSIDISSGFTPQSGTIMSTRPGDFDPFVIPYVLKQTGMSIEQLNQAMIKDSGLFGISGISGDMRDLEEAARKGHDRAKLAIAVFCYQIKKYIGAFTASMNGIDVVVFTGGIGENSTTLRQMVCSNLSYLGIILDPQMNLLSKKPRFINASTSKVKVAVIATNEEYMVAQKVLEALPKT